MADLASRSSERLQGVISFHEEAMPICGLAKSSSPMPTARSIPGGGPLQAVGDISAAGFEIGVSLTGYVAARNADDTLGVFGTVRS